MIISLTSLSKRVEKQTHDKITEDGVGSGGLTAVVTVEKRSTFIEKLTGVIAQRIIIFKTNLKYK